MNTWDGSKGEHMGRFLVLTKNNEHEESSPCTKYAAKQTARYIARRSAVKSTIRTSVARYTVGNIAGRYASTKISSKYYSFRMRRCM